MQVCFLLLKISDLLSLKFQSNFSRWMVQLSSQSIIICKCSQTTACRGAYGCMPLERQWGGDCWLLEIFRFSHWLWTKKHIIRSLLHSVNFSSSLTLQLCLCINVHSPSKCVSVAIPWLWVPFWQRDSVFPFVTYVFLSKMLLCKHRFVAAQFLHLHFYHTWKTKIQITLQNFCLSKSLSYAMRSLI